MEGFYRHTRILGRSHSLTELTGKGATFERGEKQELTVVRQQPQPHKNQNRQRHPKKKSLAILNKSEGYHGPRSSSYGIVTTKHGSTSKQEEEHGPQVWKLATRRGWTSRTERTKRAKEARLAKSKVRNLQHYFFTGNRIQRAPNYSK